VEGTRVHLRKPLYPFPGFATTRPGISHHGRSLYILRNASAGDATIPSVLLDLHIAGLGVIEDVTLELPPGLSVLTGETGAGKTMVTEGLALVLGRRARAGLVRDGAGRAGVEARFQVPGPRAQGWAEDGELVLGRTVSADGRSTARAGGRLAPLSVLAELGGDLVEIHGQHEAQRLSSPAAQLAFLDRFCGTEHRERVSAYRVAHRELRETRDRLDRLVEDERHREREKDLLAYQVREIEAAGLRPGEVADLEAEVSRLGHAERLRELAGTAGRAIAVEGGGEDSLRSAAAAAGEAAAVDPSAGDLARRVASLALEAADVAASLRSYAESIEVDPARLEAMRDRIAAIRSLERKYGEGESEVLSFLERARVRLTEVARSGAEREELAARRSRLEEEAGGLALRLTEGRREAGPRLAAALRSELVDLGMEGARVDVHLVPEAGLGPDGHEGASLLFSGGPGQPPQPIQRVASGGELSRMMLACRTVLADLDDVPTLVFDEVDSGIGGRAGVAVGRRLARLARRRQVVVVTHLPQIACFADRHFRVTKEDGVAVVDALEGSERVDELSRMLSGMPTEEAATHASQLLAEAARERG
jgi:DNA repair protein RecN (Recombination protein N)